jgi:Spy/CpxP family protein refolding chaperone
MLRSEKPDRDAVMKKVQEISDLRRAMMVQHIDALLASKTVLTPEQQEKIRSFLERRRAGFGPEGVRERGPRLPQEPGSPPEPPRSPDEPSVQ